VGKKIEKYSKIGMKKKEGKKKGKKKKEDFVHLEQQRKDKTRGTFYC